LYEVAGMPQTNARELAECQGDPCTLPATDFDGGAFAALALNHLVEWVANGKTPPRAPHIEVDPCRALRRPRARVRAARPAR
jgi:hypothetical protein